MKIARYTDAAAELVGSRTKPEPWLHIGLDCNKEQGVCYYAIWIWDTRKVVEDGMRQRFQNEQFAQVSKLAPAKDNKQPLNGLRVCKAHPKFTNLQGASKERQSDNVRKETIELWSKYVDLRDRFNRELEERSNRLEQDIRRIIEICIKFGQDNDIRNWAMYPLHGNGHLEQYVKFPFPDNLKKSKRQIQQQ